MSAAVCIAFDVLLTFNFTHSRPFCALATLFDFYATAASVLLARPAHHPLSLSPFLFSLFFGSFYFSNSAWFRYCDMQRILSFFFKLTLSKSLSSCPTPPLLPLLLSISQLLPLSVTAIMLYVKRRQHLCSTMMHRYHLQSGNNGNCDVISG